MKKSLSCILLLITCAIGALAQGPPPVLYIVREDIKPGMMSAHNRHSAQFASMFGKLGTPNYRIALTPIAGSENEVIYISGTGSFADLEKMTTETGKRLASLSGTMRADFDRLDKEAPSMHMGMRDIIATLRPDISFNPTVNLPTMRYFAITTIRVRPGQDDQFAEYIKTVLNTAREKAKAELHIAAFQVAAGMPSGTYMFFRPLKSLAEYDQRIGQRVRESMGEDQRKKADKMLADTIMSSETNIYAMTPAMSYVDKEFAAGDPAFWTPKPAMAAKPTPKRKQASSPPPGQ